MRLDWCAAVFGLTGWVALASASPIVVADSACPRHAIDIEAFATCEGDRVATPEPEMTVDRRMPTVSLVRDPAQGSDAKAADGGVELPSSVDVARAGSRQP